MKHNVYKKDATSDYDTIFIHVTQKEALEIIQSLTNQILTGSPNSGRLETFTDDGKYLSIAVDFKKLREMKKYDMLEIK